MKKTKIIVPALGMLLLSTAASVTGTVAWFAVNTSVTVTGLQVKAKAEGGIAIAPYSITQSAVASEGTSLTSFGATAPANNSAFAATAYNNLGLASLYPTSTDNASDWWHATSSSYNSHLATSIYSDLTSETGWQNDGKIFGGTGAANDLYVFKGQYYLYNKYKVKSTSTDNFDLYVRSITVEDDNDPADETSVNINKALRIAIQAGEAAPKFFAPKRTGNLDPVLKWVDSVDNEGAATLAAADLAFGATPNTRIAQGTVNNTGIDLQIWVYYEGEDPECKTVNIDGITVDELNISFEFATTSNA